MDVLLVESTLPLTSCMIWVLVNLSESQFLQLKSGGGEMTPNFWGSLHRLNLNELIHV